MEASVDPDQLLSSLREAFASCEDKAEMDLVEAEALDDLSELIWILQKNSSVTIQMGEGTLPNLVIDCPPAVEKLREVVEAMRGLAPLQELTERWFVGERDSANLDADDDQDDHDDDDDGDDEGEDEDDTATEGRMTFRSTIIHIFGKGLPGVTGFPTTPEAGHLAVLSLLFAPDNGCGGRRQNKKTWNDVFRAERRAIARARKRLNTG